eukprot:XP_011675551.1 PREDICTED: uncharacterized protein LOC105443721 [Strongylocentrotus purpuratus]
MYLDVPLDRSLTFHEHAKATAQKTQAGASFLKKLAGTGWGADFTTLHTSTLALAFSTAAYAAPAWSHSTHVHKVDFVLNDAMRLISGTLTATPVSNLPILSGIPPAHLRRDAQYTKLAQKHDRDKCLVPAPSAFEGQRIPRRNFATQAAELPLEKPASTLPTWITKRWSDLQWNLSTINLKEFVPEPCANPSGSDLSRKAWVNLDRIRTGVCSAQHFLHNIGADPLPNCACGEIQTLDHIIDSRHTMR